MMSFNEINLIKNKYYVTTKSTKHTLCAMVSIFKTNSMKY